MVFDFARRALSAVELGGLLRVDHRHAGDRMLVSQVPFPFVMPLIQVLNHLETALIVHRSGHHVEPRTQSVGDAVENPETSFGGALYRVPPPVRDDNSTIAN